MNEVTWEIMTVNYRCTLHHTSKGTTLIEESLPTVLEG